MKPNEEYVWNNEQDVHKQISNEYRINFVQTMAFHALGGAMEPAGDAQAQSLQNIAIFATSDVHTNFQEFSCILSASKTRFTQQKIIIIIKLGFLALRARTVGSWAGPN